MTPEEVVTPTYHAKVNATTAVAESETAEFALRGLRIDVAAHLAVMRLHT